MMESCVHNTLNAHLAKKEEDCLLAFVAVPRPLHLEEHGC